MDIDNNINRDPAFSDNPLDKGVQKSPLFNGFIKRREKFIVLLLLIVIACTGGYWIYQGNRENKEALLNQSQVVPTKVPYRETDKLVKEGNSTDLTKYNLAAPDYKINFEFARYNINNTSYKLAVPDYSLSSSELYNLPFFETNQKMKFSDQQRNLLDNTNFFIAQNTGKFWEDDLDAFSRTDDWTFLYKAIGGGPIWERAPQNSVFISSDFLLHVYHKLLEKEFEYLENKNLYPSLKAMTDAVLTGAIADYKKQADAENKASYERIMAFFAVPKAILDGAAPELNDGTLLDQHSDTNDNIINSLEAIKPKIPDFSYQKAKAELSLILDGKTTSDSPLFNEYWSKANLNNPQDYTQFVPRSHYNKNSILRSYFRTMMWYGRNPFVLSSKELTRDAVNISLLTKNTGQLKNWENIYVPTAFLAGKSDDLGIFEYNKSLTDMGATIINTDTVSKVMNGMKNYQGPQIMSSVFIGDEVFNTSKQELLAKTKSFRFMGQRFTPDAFIFTSLTQGDEKPDPVTKQKLPSQTTGLMVMSILGSKTADPLVRDWISNNAPGSSLILANNLGALKNQFAKLGTDVWTQNIYWSWLYTINSLFTESDNISGYPNFMKNDMWHTKNLQSALGSWTELKHNTLLYAKQSYAEMGGGGPDDRPAVPKGYVEPNIKFLDRLIALVKFTNDGLKNRGLLDQESEGRNNILVKDLSFFEGLAVKELGNEKISDDDFETLRTIFFSLDSILWPITREDPREKDARSALIADVQTDVPDGKILYEANAIPNYIYVAVKDINGTRLTKGLVYNYYEFYAPLGKRLADEDWWKQVYTADKSMLPQAPAWTQKLYK